MSQALLTVTQVNRFLKSLIEGDGRLGDIMITGELSNFTGQHRSGHMYFSLKDDRSVIRAVMFSSAVSRLRFRPADGMKVIIRGRVSVYEASGQYQLYVEDMQPDGIGALAMAFEQLKARLTAEGLFDPDRKRPLPPYPQRIGVVTSPTGAAVRDILQITARRWPLAEIVFCPVLVQGESASAQITAAVQALNRARACDVMIVGRGGGSMEDLWAFNDEALARAVAASEIPVVSAVGHETDFTICDFAADLRAPTPSAAAELCTPDRDTELDRLLAYHRYFQDKGLGTVQDLRQRVDLLLRDSPLNRPGDYTLARRARLEELSARLEAQGREQMNTRRQTLALLSGKLDAMSPLKVLSRGYSVVYHGGKAVRDLTGLPAGEEVTLQVETGRRQAKLV
ncbi:exodeoxyribonuclease VII large subunit [Acutalibacter sp. 1XD8-33]|nr:exodeoxyribonuclease VII large subunit [Acutalibacter sp. 1XD8-33]RKJ40059.1 exodeoxyribonuclease VII large subunit [Acutalibacter sp. 1XD8-33]